MSVDSSQAGRGSRQGWKTDSERVQSDPLHGKGQGGNRGFDSLSLRFDSKKYPKIPRKNKIIEVPYDSLSLRFGSKKHPKLPARIKVIEVPYPHTELANEADTLKRILLIDDVNLQRRMQLAGFRKILPQLLNFCQPFTVVLLFLGVRNLCGVPVQVIVTPQKRVTVVNET